MVMDETYVVNQMKEDVCYVSSNFMEDMKIARSGWIMVVCDIFVWCEHYVENLFFFVAIEIG